METIQKIVLTTIHRLAPYQENLCTSGLVSLKDNDNDNENTLFYRHVIICSDLYKEMCKPDHKLNHLIPKPHEYRKSQRNAPPIDPPKFRTTLYRHTFILYTLTNFQ